MTDHDFKFCDDPVREVSQVADKNETELEPCPFCGGDASGIVVSHIQFMISCNNGDCDTSGGLYDSKGAAIKAWNTRAKPRPTGDRAKALEAFGITRTELIQLLNEAKSRYYAKRLDGYTSIITADLNKLIKIAEYVAALSVPAAPVVDVEELKRDIAIEFYGHSEEKWSLPCGDDRLIDYLQKRGLLSEER